MNPRKIIVPEIEAGGVLEVFDFLAEAVGQAGHPAHRHAHR